MLNQNHPDDERLSALASRDADATADAMLTAHVSSCDRCTELVDELGALRVALADLPDLQPSRPLQLVPPVEADHAVDRAGGWARRFFAPVLASGAALALVGVIGSAAPAVGNFAATGGATAPQEAAAASVATEPDDLGAPSAPSVEPGYLQGEGAARDSATSEPSNESQTFATDGEVGVTGGAESGEGGQDELTPGPVESSRSPWPMVLFAGVALMVAAGLMRWILSPRAG